MCVCVCVFYQKIHKEPNTHHYEHIHNKIKPPKIWYFVMWTTFELGPDANIIIGCLQS